MMNDAPRHRHYLGSCPTCGHGLANTETATATCTNCSTTVVLSRIIAVYAEHAPCDASCMYAAGPNCSCNCGGDNHGRGYIAPVGERPVWVTKRDTDRHAAKLARAEAKARDERTAAQREQDRLLAQHPQLARLTHCQDGSDFMADMLSAFEAGKMTPRQADAAARAVDRHEVREARRAEQAARVQAAVEAGVTLPTGRVTITGEIVSIREQENPFSYNSSTWKMVVASPEGWRVWMTCPDNLVSQAMDEQYAAQTSAGSKTFVPWTQYLLGREVTVTVTISPSDKDPLFGFGKTPKKATVGQPVAA